MAKIDSTISAVVVYLNRLPLSTECKYPGARPVVPILYRYALMEKNMPENNDQDQRLRDFWERRAELTKSEHTELYQMVYAILMRYARAPKVFSIINELPYEAEDYINQFYLKRVVEGQGGNVDHAGALCLFFYHFLVTHNRQEHIPGNIGTGGQDDEDDRPAVETEPTVPPCWQKQDEVVEEVLNEYGLDACRVQQRALDLLTGCEIWARLMLRLHYCQNPDDAGYLPMNQLAKNYQIPAYQYRAGQLGVVIPGALHRSEADFYRHYSANTLLGRWFTQTLGVQFTAENATIFLACLKILCHVTLNRVNPLTGDIQ